MLIKSGRLRAEVEFKYDDLSPLVVLSDIHRELVELNNKYPDFCVFIRKYYNLDVTDGWFERLIEDDKVFTDAIKSVDTNTP